ncbi:hypothetical protein F441_11494 [Phytophthora nicotianae CJ01A1]|uniref:Uncharacterized protein n=2 Tax=Phytophthora nicotianae TaxID=4792 RepID=W2Z249_PHYNI|nr:hypothetical protein F441_11494 [Phytophthora nicotianae CJ01A1]ETP41338.1 hypothetical protein F442_11481 [Phytophthora nicotianae P10297]
MQGIKCVRILNEQRPDVNEGAHENKSNRGQTDCLKAAGNGLKRPLG